MSLEENKDDEENKDNEESRLNKTCEEVFKLIIRCGIVAVLAWLILTFVGQTVKISGTSMCGTFDDEDIAWLDKITYDVSKPKRYDVIVFPHEDYNGNDSHYVKRIIGMPGETISIKQGSVYINGELLKSDIYGWSDMEYDVEDTVIGEDEYFVMGDNRADSKDSRSLDVGNIKLSDIEGKVVFRFNTMSKV